MQRRIVEVGLWLLVGLGLVMMPACYSAPEPDCGFVCGSGGTCPGDYTCASDHRCHRDGTPASLTCSPLPLEFDLQEAVPKSNTQLYVIFGGTPDPAAALMLSSYSVSCGSVTLPLGGTPMLAGAQVILTTAPQSETACTLTVTGITRAIDGEPLTVATATFTGRSAFNVASAASIGNGQVSVTFDAPPDPGQAQAFLNYDIPGLTVLSLPVLVGNVATFSTDMQAMVTYSVTVAGVERASDFEPLTVSTATFTGRPSFNVASAASFDSTTITLTFDAPPNGAQATTLGNYDVPGLSLTGTPVLNSNTVTITTSAHPGCCR